MSSDVTTAWLLLALAGLFEVGWALGLEYADGFANARASVLTIGAMLVSFALLAKAVDTLPVGTAYVVWIGIGAFGTVVGGVVLFEEPTDLRRFGFLSLIVIGVLGLKASSTV